MSFTPLPLYGRELGVRDGFNDVMDTVFGGGAEMIVVPETIGLG